MGDTTGISWTDRKWCTSCKTHHHRREFGKDKSRGDGLAARCLASRRSGNPKGWHSKPCINSITGKPGPAPSHPRDGDKTQARQRINVEVRTGYRPHPNKLPCADCGHIWKLGERRHEYDHHMGYSPENHYEAEAVCTTCHRKRSVKRGELIQKRDSYGMYCNGR